MRYYSTNSKKNTASLSKAVLSGLADDGGLYMPEAIPRLPASLLNNLAALTFRELSFEIAKQLLGEDIPHPILEEIINDALNFEVPLVQLDHDLYVLELFHGPTLAFKDFAARFMARLMSYLNRDSDAELTILVATSGDTGSAVAHGFAGAPGIRVFILYPSGKISTIQEKQLTTHGGNITALEIDGSFDDCQRIAKQAFLDVELSRNLTLTSANSINIARLIPQSFYYFYGYARLKNKRQPVVISVPSGNFGNLTGGLIAKKMGLPIARFISATNANRVVPEFLQTGRFEPKPTRQTISNAMDVGNPSNFARILDLCNNDLEKMREDVWGASFTDDQTRDAIQELVNKFGYIPDPHGAVGYLGLKHYPENKSDKLIGIFLETAHPAKFPEVIRQLIDRELPLPEALEKAMSMKKHSVKLSGEFDAVKQYLLSVS
ncbi:threonine synthase [candidate division KSB1 bacterium]|nr:threonine synthase [candidate division KSB1 bacterium]